MQKLNLWNFYVFWIDIIISKFFLLQDSKEVCTKTSRPGKLIQ